MNDELRQLLRQAGIAQPVHWRDVIVMYGYAPVPPPAHARTDLGNWNRGFNLVVLVRGRPEYFVKCRPTGDPILQWETEIRSAVAGERPDGLSVAPVQAASSGRLAVQVSPFHRGPHYGRLVHKQSTEDFLRTLRTALFGNAEVATLALERCARVRSPTSVIALSTAAGSIAEIAAVANLGDREQAALIGALEAAGDVPLRPQHGDFWWQNLIVTDHHLWAIDFDSYGDVKVPLFDDMTLVMTTMNLRAGGAVEGLERLMSKSAEANACCAILAERATAEGVTISQLNGVLVYYLVHMASIVHRRGGLKFSGPHLAVARRAAEILVSGRPLL